MKQDPRLAKAGETARPRGEIAHEAAEIARRKLPAHPLAAQGYKSIGCAPCTKPVAAGEDERAGRWAHTIGLENEQKTECGIHLPADGVGDWTV